MPSSAIQLRNLIEADLPFAMGLKTMSGWNQIEADWRRFLELEPQGCFVAECDGRPAGTATALCYERKFGWIGMMLVAPEFRRRGIASALLRHSLDYLAARGVETAKLDATPLGKAVYDQCGFKDEYLIDRCLRPSNRQFPCNNCNRDFTHSYRPVLPNDLEPIAEFDAPIFGADRGRLLASLLRDAPELGFCTDGGFVLGRHGSTATQIGPLVANDIVAAERLLQAVLVAVGYGAVLLDVPLCNEAAVELSARYGFEKQRTLIRQYNGSNRYAGHSHQVFAIAGPELG